jgi:long-chain acyl-CoA synthetase
MSKNSQGELSSIEIVMGRMVEFGDKPALFCKNSEISYREFNAVIDIWSNRLRESKIEQGTVCGLLGEFSLQTCALIFALMRAKSIIVPFTTNIENELEEFKKIAGVQILFIFDEDDNWTSETYEDASQNELVAGFKKENDPGLIVFSSGSTGKPKGILQNCEKVMHKFVEQRSGWRTVLFLMMDHFGGFNTLLSTFAYGGVAVSVHERSLDVVCRAIEQSQATLLPATPTFLNLLIASGIYKKFDLTSVKLITYGTEVISDATLKKIKVAFPEARLKQTYGLSELGVLRSKSESDNSPWVKIGGKGFETKVVDDLLWVRSEANMVGYLNAPNPYDEEGWMCTSDRVEIKGEFMRILGRETDIINVGGQKVFPVEIENVLLEVENVTDASVFGVAHSLMGQVVHAKVTLARPEDHLQLTPRLRKACRQRLAKYKIPVRFQIVPKTEHSTRFKKIRE